MTDHREKRVSPPFLYQQVPQAPHEMNAIFGSGMFDKVTTPEMDAWRELTTGPFTLHTLPGNHQFLHENQDQKQLLELISQDLEK